MNKDEMKNKYTAFISEISEVLGLGKPVDIIKLCATTDLFFQPLEKRIAELETRCNELFFQVNEKTERIAALEKENAELKKQLETVKEECCGKVFCPYRSEISLSEVEK